MQVRGNSYSSLRTKKGKPKSSGRLPSGLKHPNVSQQNLSSLTICNSSLFRRWSDVSSQIPPRPSCANLFAYWIYETYKKGHIRHISNESWIYNSGSTVYVFIMKRELTLRRRSTRATVYSGQWRSSLRGAVQQFALLLVVRIDRDAYTWKTAKW